jgi:hypothetical protein
MNDLGVPPALNSKRGSPPSGLHLRFGASLNSARHWRLYSGATLRAANAPHPNRTPRTFAFDGNPNDAFTSTAHAEL